MHKGSKFASRLNLFRYFVYQWFNQGRTNYGTVYIPGLSENELYSYCAVLLTTASINLCDRADNQMF